MRVPLLWLVLAVFVSTACGGAAGAQGASAGSAPAATRGPSAADLASVARGDSLFNAGACQRCHGHNGTGAPNGPNLIDGQWLHIDGSQSSIATIIVNGIPREAVKDTTRRFPMRPRGGPMNLTDEQVQDLANYVVSLSRGKTAR